MILISRAFWQKRARLIVFKEHVFLLPITVEVLFQRDLQITKKTE